MHEVDLEKELLAEISETLRDIHKELAQLKAIVIASNGIDIDGRA